MKDEYLKTGTTTVGIVCKDGIILAADRRATAGNFIANKNMAKILKITDNIAVTTAGMVSDVQLLVKYIQAELRLKKIRTGQEPTAKEAANLLGRMVYNNIRKMSMIPGISHFVLGGKDKSGFHIFDLSPDGSIVEVDDFIGSGSGSVMAYGVLETLFKKDMTVDEAVKLGVKCINAALQRDSASGSGIDVFAITKDGVKNVLERDLSFKVQI